MSPPLPNRGGIQVHSDAILAALAHLQSDVSAIKKHIDGGSEPATGLLMRVDRIEQREIRNSKIAQTALGFALTAIGGFVATLISVLWKRITGHTQ